MSFIKVIAIDINGNEVETLIRPKDIVSVSTNEYNNVKSHIFMENIHHNPLYEVKESIREIHQKIQEAK